MFGGSNTFLTSTEKKKAYGNVLHFWGIFTAITFRKSIYSSYTGIKKIFKSKNKRDKLKKNSENNILVPNTTDFIHYFKNF